MMGHLSAAFTLEPGDIISTGTPAGVGMARTPPVWLRAGDTVRIEIERVGVLENPVVDEPDPVPTGLPKVSGAENEAAQDRSGSTSTRSREPSAPEGRPAADSASQRIPWSAARTSQRPSVGPITSTPGAS